MKGRVLVVAGEPSGDRTLATVVRALGRPTFGFGGDALAREGTELIAHVRELSAMGIVEVLRGAPTVLGALARLLRVVRRERPRVAILASWSTANGRLAPLLRREGVRVVWISPPEVWAWREARAPRLARAVDRMIVTLPFEERLWRDAGADAHYVGHPIVDVPRRHPARTGVALLPGSRRAEIERLLPMMRGALPDAPVITHGAADVVESFEAALCCSGTASLECAAMGTPMVIAYAVHPITHRIGRALVRTKHIGLPNVLLERSGRRAAFPELIQDEVTPENLLRALDVARGQRAACDTVRALLGEGPFAARAATLIEELDADCPSDGRARSGRW